MPKGKLDSADLQQIDKAYRTLRVIWIGMLASLGVYILIANLLGPVLGMMPMFAGTDDPAVAKYGWGLYGIAVAELVVVYFFRRGLTQQKDAGSRASDRLDYLSFQSAQQPVSWGVQEALGMYKNGMILSLGIAEAIALCGFMGFIIRTDYLQLYLLTAVSLAALVYIRPKKQEMIDLAERLKKDKKKR